MKKNQQNSIDKTHQESEEKYRTLIQKIKAAIVVHGADTSIIISNPMAQELLGLTEEQMLGKSVIDLDWHFFREDGTIMPVEEYPVNMVLTTGQALRSYIVGVHRSNKEMDVWVIVTADPVFGKKGQISEVIVTFIDITERKQAEKANQELDRTLRLNKAFLSAIPTPVFFKDIEGRYLGCNQAFSEFMGVTPDQIRGKTVYELWPSEYAEMYHRKDLEIMRNPAHQVYEFKVKDKDGMEHPVIYFKDVFRDENDEVAGIVGAFLDITQRKQAEMEIVRVNRSLRMLSDSNQALIRMTDEVTLLNEVCRISVEVGGFPVAWVGFAEDVENKTIKVVAHAGLDVSYIESEIEKWTDHIIENNPTTEAIRTGKPNIIPDILSDPFFTPWVKTVAKLGARSFIALPLMGEIQPFGVLNIFARESNAFDEREVEILTELAGDLAFGIIALRARVKRKKTEEALHHSEEKYRALVENLSEVIFTLDTQGCFSYISPAIEQYTGFRTNEVIGMPFTRFIHPDDLNGLVSSFERSLTGQLESYEFRVLNKDGTIRQVRTSSRQLMEEGKASGLTGIMSDITEHKKAEEELLKAKVNAEESNRLKSAFLATMNHELRTPLNHILGFSDLMRSGAVMENIADYSDIIYKSSQSLLEIIEGIFELALAEQSEIKLKLQTFKCLDLFLSNKSVLNEILEISGKKDQIELFFNADKQLLLQNISTDRNKINQVLLNLFKNAVKFTKAGKIEFGLKTEEPGWLVLYVSDTGIGIPEEKHKIIFEFFRQADDSHTREYGGVGIGLAISKKIAELMNGTLSLKSETGMGSTFYFRIPIETEHFRNSQMNDIKKELSIPTLEGKTVLIAEDDPASMILIKKYLVNTGVQLIEAVNGKEAIDNLDKNPDLILMDLKMPVIDGYTATRIIKSQRPEIPVIALTAYALSSDQSKAFVAGCDGIISKPVAKRILLDELRKLLLPDKKPQ